MKKNKKNIGRKKVVSRREKEIFGIFLVIISLSMISSTILSNPLKYHPEHFLGMIGNWLSHFPYIYFGYSSIGFAMSLLIIGYAIFTKKQLSSYISIILKIIAATFWMSSFFSYLYYVILELGPEIESSLQLLLNPGVIGYALYMLFSGVFGQIGYFIILSITLILLITWFFDLSNYEVLNKFYNSVKSQILYIFNKSKNKFSKGDVDDNQVLKESSDDVVIKNNDYDIQHQNNSIDNEVNVTEDSNSKEDINENNINQSTNFETIDSKEDNETENSDVVIEDEREIIEGDLDAASKKNSTYFNYKLPLIDNLNSPIEIQNHDEEELKRKAEEIVYAINSFGVSCEVVKISPGPVVTLYEIEPAEGVRVNKITNLSEDLSRIMGGKRVRVLDNIPGTRSVGIELPNDRPSIVYLKNIINSQKFIDSKSKLNIALGKTTTGDAYVFDLGRMPHLLVAGATGAGKSVCINTIIVSILYNAKPDEVKFILMDPKKVELSTYKSLVGYHLITAKNIDEYVMTTAENSVSILESAINEMEKRFQLFSEVRVRNIEEYHNKYKENNELEVVPYIVVIIDELADLMMTSGRSIEEPITRLAQKARAVGIHLIVATQRPSVDVITGLIKSNFPARISFQVSSRVDSRTIIDQIGAEKLLGRGDMLFLLPGTAAPIRLHNAFITLEEIEKIMDHIVNQPKPDELKLPEIKKNSQENNLALNDNQDELLEDAAKLVVDYQQASVSLLQRKFRIGYSRAGRIIDELESLGIISEYNGSKAREVLFTHNQLTDLFSD